MPARIEWPEGKRFAFTVFDDTDLANLGNVGEVYALLADLGFRTTKSCWPFRGDPSRGANVGQTCEDPEYCDWLLGLQAKGFEIAWHGPTWHSSPRAETLRALDRFAALFGHDPFTAANHTGAANGIYWAEKRVTGIHVPIYHLLTRMRRHNIYYGEVENDPHYWGDLCRRIKYYRNFVFEETNTLRACPLMPYHDCRRPLVNQWFAASNGIDLRRFNLRLSEDRQDRLEEEGGACIIHTHFAFHFEENGVLDARFRSLMERLAKKGGWFVPTHVLLDHLAAVGNGHDITDRQRGRMERKWLLEKIVVGWT